MPDKVLIPHNGQLQAKYGANRAAVDAAIQRLIAADAQRGLNSIYIAIDDSAAVGSVGGAAVPGAPSEADAKAAVDAIYNYHQPDYLVLLGGPDVIPHQSLTNPMYSPPDDPDGIVPSDLPYACSNPYSSEPQDFVGPVRVVTRIPDLTASSDAPYFAAVLDSLAAAVPGNHEAYMAYLGVTAQVWAPSTELSLKAIFGNAAQMQCVPPASYRWSAAQAQRLSHFFNCHGAPNDHRFYGQQGRSYPPAHDASYVAGLLHPGTVLAAECCYGAQLYDPSRNGGHMGMANVYMRQGAYGYFGSTTIAYGPASGNANADLICQYFLKEVLRGGSVGSAALSARQRFAEASSAISPTDLKTMAQFIVLGDASVHCVHAQSPVKDTAAKYGFAQFPPGDAEARARKERRAAAAEVGFFLQHAKRVSGKQAARTSDVARRLNEMAQAAGYREPKVLSFGISEPAGSANTKALAGVPPISAFHVLMETTDSNAPRGLSTRMLEAQEANGEIVSVRELFSR